MEEKEPKRYQECSWYEKLWRCRWYICVPFYAFYLWFDKEVVTNDDTEEEAVMPFWLCWSCSVGHFECAKMQFYYTTEEVFARIGREYDIDINPDEATDLDFLDDEPENI